MAYMELYYESSNGDLYAVLRVTRDYFKEPKWKEPEISLRTLLSRTLENLRPNGKTRITKGTEGQYHFYIGREDRLEEIIQEFKRKGVRTIEGIPNDLIEDFQQLRPNLLFHTQPTP